MTLVIAHKSGEKISLSSDSRISFGTAGCIDYGIKIFSIPVKIFSPVNITTGVKTLDYNHQHGLAVIGSAMNAYTIKESVSEFLQNLQYIPEKTDISMDGIARLIFQVFNKTTLDFGSLIQKNGICELILSGYCKTQTKIRIFKYSCHTLNHPIQPFYNEILTSNGIEFFGSGKIKAQNIFTQDPHLSPLHIIRKVIHDNNVKSVGGGLQYGDFKKNNFEICGIIDYKLNPNGSFKEYTHSLRGIDLYKGDLSGDFHIAYDFINPFQKDIDALLKY